MRPWYLLPERSNATAVTPALLAFSAIRFPTTAAAAIVGKRIAEKAKSAGVTSVAFDRSGNKYHGRIKALADAAREHGLQF